MRLNDRKNETSHDRRLATPARTLLGRVHVVRVTRRVASGAALSAVIGAIALAGPSESLAIPGEDSEPSVGSIEQPLETKWIEGSSETHYGSAFNGGNGGVGKVLGSSVWYTNEAATGEVPKVGETWIGAAHVGVVDPNIGTTAVEFVVKPPPNTSFAIDANHKIACSNLPSGASVFVDATQDPSANCPSAPIPTAEGWSLGTRRLAKGTQFVIDFPLKSTAPLHGASGPNGGDKLAVITRPDNAETKEPYVNVSTFQPTADRHIAWFMSCLWDNPANPGPC